MSLWNLQVNKMPSKNAIFDDMIQERRTLVFLKVFHMSRQYFLLNGRHHFIALVGHLGKTNTNCQPLIISIATHTWRRLIGSIAKRVFCSSSCFHSLQLVSLALYFSNSNLLIKKIPENF